MEYNNLASTSWPILPLWKLELTIQCYNPSLQDSDRLWHAFLSLPIIVLPLTEKPMWSIGRRRCISQKKWSPDNFCCEARRCKTCHILVTTNTFPSSATGERFNLKLCTSCKTSNIMYIIQCRVQEVWSPICGRKRQSLNSWVNSHGFNSAHSCINESPEAAHLPVRATLWPIYRSWSWTNAGRTMSSLGRSERADG